MDSKNTLATAPPWWVRAVVGRYPKRTMVRAIVLATVLIFTFRFVLLPVRVVGTSMYPNYRNHTVNFVNRLAYWRHPPGRGDVVGIGFSGSKIMLLKRIIGLPGERIRITDGIVYVNDEPLAEPYLKEPPAPWNRPEEKLGPHEYFVIGDNRTMDPENHDMGPFDGTRILGKVLF